VKLGKVAVTFRRTEISIQVLDPHEFTLLSVSKGVDLEGKITPALVQFDFGHRVMDAEELEDHLQVEQKAKSTMVLLDSIVRETKDFREVDVARLDLLICKFWGVELEDAKSPLYGFIPDTAFSRDEESGPTLLDEEPH